MIEKTQNRKTNVAKLLFAHKVPCGVCTPSVEFFISEPFWLTHKYFFIQISVEKGSLNIQCFSMQSIMYSNSKEELSCTVFGYWGKNFKKIIFWFLRKVFCNKTGFKRRRSFTISVLYWITSLSFYIYLHGGMLVKVQTFFRCVIIYIWTLLEVK